jgi:hypothetical protein
MKLHRSTLRIPKVLKTKSKEQCPRVLRSQWEKVRKYIMQEKRKTWDKNEEEDKTD